MHLTLLTSLAALMLATPLAATQDQKPTPAEQAKTAAEVFMRGFQYLNLDDIMKVVDVPWYHNRKTVIYKRAELETDFGRLLAKYKGSPKVKYELRLQITYAEVREKTPADERKLIDQVLTLQDFVQFVKLTNPNTGAEESAVLYVRIKDGQARVVGLEN